MILLIDADSLIFASCYKPKDKILNSIYYKRINKCKDKFDGQLINIITDLEEMYDIKEVRIFSGRSKNNFRKLLSKTYKSHRSTKPPMLDKMHQYVREHYQAIQSCGHETDDAVAKYWYEIQKVVGRDNVIIVSIDKDYMQFPALIYNYHPKHKKIYNLSEQDAMYNFYEQMIIGDTADNVNYFKGLGKAFAKKYLQGCDSKYKYTKKLYELFKMRYKQKAKLRYIECYNLLKLRTDV